MVACLQSSIQYSTGLSLYRPLNQNYIYKTKTKQTQTLIQLKNIKRPEEGIKMVIKKIETRNGTREFDQQKRTPLSVISTTE